MNTHQNTTLQHCKLGFFGTPQIAVWVLEELEKKGIVPSLVVTNPDAPQGRKLILTPSPVSVWADNHHIPTLKPEALRDTAVETELRNYDCDLFIVAAYGKMIPENILNIPKYKTLNVHPSLLPLLRGASPIRSAILNDIYPTGVSIMVLTPGMDEGPIIAQEEAPIPKESWPMRGNELDELLARHGGRLLAEVLPKWIRGGRTAHEQDHTKATYCTKITKDMGEINLTDNPEENLRKIRAFEGWPGTFFFVVKNGKRVRVKITDAERSPDGSLRILRVIPEGKKEMSYEDFVR